MQIYREEFNKMERKARLTKRNLLFYYSALCMLLTVINCVILIDWKPQYVCIAYNGLLLGGYFIILRRYVYYRVAHYRLMREKHV